LIDMHDEWLAAQRHYPSEASMVKLHEVSDTRPVAAIKGGK